MGLVSYTEIRHYGTPHVGYQPHSGRYRWGSGQDPHKHYKDFRARYEDLKQKGLTEKEIAKGMGFSSTEKLRAAVSISKDEERIHNINRARRLKTEKGYANTTIATIMGVPESTVRTWLKEGAEYRNNQTRMLADQVKGLVDKYKMLDVGEGVNLHLGVSDTKLKTAVAMLEAEGYHRQTIQIEQLGTGNKTTVTVLTKEPMTKKELYEHRGDIKALGSKIIDDTDGTRIFENNAFSLQSIDGKRVMIRYNEDGGLDRDGTIELRRGVGDLSLGRAMYAQVRIAVDGTHYLKGMALYGDDTDFPPGVDVIFNTNKHRGTAPDKVFKPLKEDKTNPFGASIKDEEALELTQRYYIDANGQRQLSAINVVNEQGDWSRWSKTLSSQFLSKQPTALIERQLKLSHSEKLDEYNEIMALTNPTVRKRLLASFADDCDASAVHLKAAGLPNQSTKVLLPFPDIPDGECYCPTLANGTRVVLIRHPHGGTFEIPELVVNNNLDRPNRLIHNAPDAIGVNKKAADQLSGADFDGDTALVIPVNANVKISARSPLPQLADYDPKERYPYVPGMKEIKKKGGQQEQTEMGKVSNLITDMTLKGATDEELARAVKHSMTVIDAAKHHLNYKLSEQENGIAALKKKYQDGGGASTLISKASSEFDVLPQVGSARIDPETGKKIINRRELRTYITKDGRVVTEKPSKSTKMAETDDAFTLTSGGSRENPGTVQEALYASYANSMKALGNRARKSYVETPNLTYNPDAAKKYAAEVETLNRKVERAQKNAPLERQAEIIGGVIYQSIKQANPDMDKEHLQKARGRSLTIARDKVGAKKQRVDISEKEWEAIQAGAIHDSKLQVVLRNTDLDVIRQMAMPRNTGTISDSKQQRAISMANSGYTLKEISTALGISTSTISGIISKQ